MNRTFPWLVAAATCLLASLAHAGRVRTLYTNDRVMQPIFLAMGRSTILRFDEKPKTSVIGNQNYFNVEYLGNDLTIQPQGVTTTNLFVYTESQTYGLILKVGSEAQYDDLVYVRFKPGYVSTVDSEPKKRISLLSEAPLHQRLELKGLLAATIVKVIRSVAQGVFIFDMELENLSGASLNSNEIQFMTLESGKPVPSQKSAIQQDALAPHTKSAARTIVRIAHLEAVEIVVSCRGKNGKITLPKRIFK